MNLWIIALLTVGTVIAVLVIITVIAMIYIAKMPDRWF